MKQSSDILVSVCMVTYKHQQFIADAIESVIAQQTDFRFELVIGEDCGPDDTRDICYNYQAKYPDIIHLNFQEKNVGAQNNFLDTINLCKGQYIALCEGDDYWTDSHKLQKQVDFMEQNTDCVMCAHSAQVLDWDGNLSDCNINKTKLDIEDVILEDWGIMTASILFRRDSFDPPNWFVDIRNGDMGLQLLMATKGFVGCLPDSMSVYRRHPGGISATLRPLNQAAWLSYLLYQFNKETKGRYKKLLKQKVARMYSKQIGFAKEYSLRKAAMILRCFEIISPVIPFGIRHIRK